MSERINVRASEVWDYFYKHPSEFEDKMVQIAGHTDYGVDIFLTEEKGFPDIIVMHDDMRAYEETMYGKKYCDGAVADIYDRFLTGKAFTELADIDSEQTSSNPNSEISSLDAQDIIAESELTLDGAVFEFLSTILDGAGLDLCTDDILEDIKDHFLEYLFRKHGISVFRPMYIDYGGGEVKLEEFPYEHLAFSDENNPVYKKRSSP